MKNQLDGIIETIREAAGFLMKQSKDDLTGRFSYLFEDIHNGTTAVSGALLKEYGVSTPFNVTKFMEEIFDNGQTDELPEEMEQWIEKVQQVLAPDEENIPTQKTDHLGTSAPIDREFDEMMKSIRGKTFEEIKQIIKEGFYRLKKQQRPNYDATINYYNKYKLWGLIHPEKGVYELVDNRAHAFAEHAEDFEWMYQHLCDNRSKKILYSILYYWLTSDWSKIDGIVDHTFPQYFDLDLVSCGPEEVFVDVGAFIGDSLADYVNVFGKDCYKRFYCYEILPSNLSKIRQMVEQSGLKNVEIRAKGASDKAGEMFTTDEEMSSVGQLGANGSVRVPIVAIDDDIDEPVTFIKMDIEGAEETALAGCLKKISQCHPKLSLSVYHNHKDIWKLARMIYNADPTYRFYLRYYGGNLCPTEYLLYAI